MHTLSIINFKLNRSCKSHNNSEKFPVFIFSDLSAVQSKVYELTNIIEKMNQATVVNNLATSALEVDKGGLFM